MRLSRLYFLMQSSSASRWPDWTRASVVLGPGVITMSGPLPDSTAIRIFLSPFAPAWTSRVSGVEGCAALNGATRSFCRIRCCSGLPPRWYHRVIAPSAIAAVESVAVATSADMTCKANLPECGRVCVLIALSSSTFPPFDGYSDHADCRLTTSYGISRTRPGASGGKSLRR